MALEKYVGKIDMEGLLPETKNTKTVKPITANYKPKTKLMKQKIQCWADAKTANKLRKDAKKNGMRPAEWLRTIINAQ